MSREAILIVDDEPHYLEWLEEFLIAQAYDVQFVETATEAARMTADKPFRMIIFDLNIPMSSELRELASARGDVYVKYPGLYLAWTARNAGYRDRQIIVYSVHRLEEIQRECTIIGCAYIAKGRPAIFKQELLDVLGFDPSNISQKKKATTPRPSRVPAEAKTTFKGTKERKTVKARGRRPK